MTVNFQENKLEREIAIFKAHLEGLSNPVIGQRHNLGSETIRLTINKVVKDISERAALRNRAIPAERDREARLQNKDAWLEALRWYAEDVRYKDLILPTDAVIKIGITPTFAARLKSIGISTIGELLQTLEVNKVKIERIQNGNAAAMDALENKLRIAGFDPYGGMYQVPTFASRKAA